jgi:hypothetical protein
MKLLSKYFIFFFSVMVTVGLSSCLEEKEDLYDKVGAVATIPAFTATRLSPTTGEPVTGAIRSGDPVRLTMRFYSPNVGVKELILNETIATGAKQQIDSKVITGFDRNNSYVETFNYTVPAGTSGRRITLEVVAVTENDLTNNRTLILNIP